MIEPFKPEMCIDEGAMLPSLTSEHGEDVPEEDYGFRLWPCAQVLASYIMSNSHIVMSKVVLELGCGLGLVGIVAAKFGASWVTLTDRTDADSTLARLVLRNCILNNVDGKTNYTQLIWGRTAPAFRLFRDYNVFLLSDCFYDPSVFEPVLFTLSMLIRQNPHSEAYFSYTNRSPFWSIEHLLERYQLQCQLMYRHPDGDVFIGRVVCGEFETTPDDSG